MSWLFHHVWLVGVWLMFMFQLADIDAVSNASKFIKYVKLLTHIWTFLSTLGTWFEFKILLLLDQLSPEAKEPGLPCYITYILWEKDGFITFSRSCFPQNDIYLLCLLEAMFLGLTLKKIFFYWFIV